MRLGGQNVATQVFETGRPARTDDYADATGPGADFARSAGSRSTVAVPVKVDGRLWGLMAVSSTQEPPLPVDTEARLAGFTELAATAIANADAREQVRQVAAEQAALRRVATRSPGAPPDEVFTAIAREVGRLFGTQFCSVVRFNPDRTATAVGSANMAGDHISGHTEPLGGRNASTLVFETGLRADRPVPG